MIVILELEYSIWTPEFPILRTSSEPNYFSPIPPLWGLGLKYMNLGRGRGTSSPKTYLLFICPWFFLCTLMTLFYTEHTSTSWPFILLVLSPWMYIPNTIPWSTPWAPLIFGSSQYIIPYLCYWILSHPYSPTWSVLFGSSSHLLIYNI